MSRKGQSYITAGDGRIPNQGQQSLRIVTNEGNQGRTCFQIGDVNRPLMGCTQVTDQGNDILLQSDGGFIYNKATGKVTRVERHGNVYEIDLWMSSDDANGNGGQPGFTRPGL